MTIDTFSDELQKLYREQYRERFPASAKTEIADNRVETFAVPRNYNDTVDHFKNFFTHVRNRSTPVEDSVFGFRAAGAALLSNLSLERKAIVNWNPETMKVS